MEGLTVGLFYIVLGLLVVGVLFAFSLTYLIINRKTKGLLFIKVVAGIILIISIYFLGAILFMWLII